MHKVLSCLIALSIITACSYDDDFSDERMERMTLRQSTNGCQAVIDDQKEYRACIEKTYNKNSPKTFKTGVLTTGEPVAIVKSSDESDIAVYRTAEEQQPTIKTSAQSIQNPTVKQKADIKTTNEKNTVIKKEAQTNLKQEANTKKETTKSIKTEKTWWDTYQSNKPKTKQTTSKKCPCADPNDPCLECYDK